MHKSFDYLVLDIRQVVVNENYYRVILILDNFEEKRSIIEFKPGNPLYKKAMCLVNGDTVTLLYDRQKGLFSEKDVLIDLLINGKQIEDIDYTIIN